MESIFQQPATLKRVRRSVLFLPFMARGRAPLALAAAAGAVACASSPAPSSSTLQRPVDMSFAGPRSPSSPSSSSSPVPLAVLPRPDNPAEAGLLVGEAMAALQRGERRAAIPRLQALLGSDLLSERGRANLYWLLADAAVGIDDAVRRDALGGYLVTASVLPPDGEVRDRMGRARSQLLADHVGSAALGRTPEQAIDVDEAGDVDGVVAALQCGRRGGRYVARAASTAPDERGLSMRRLLCTETGDELVLWFRVP